MARILRAEANETYCMLAEIAFFYLAQGRAFMLLRVPVRLGSNSPLLGICRCSDLLLGGVHRHSLLSHVESS